MPQRFAQVEDPAAIPAPERRMGPGAGISPDADVLRQIAGAVSALAGRVERLEERVGAGQHPVVTRAQRCEALEQARDFITELRVPPGAERVHAELAVARYLTGE